MKKLRYIGLFPIITSLTCLSVGQESVQVNKVDGFTSASNKLHVDSILVYRDHTDVFWWDVYDKTGVTTYQLEWGTKDTIHYTDTLKLIPETKRAHYVATIQPLKDSTIYFAQFNRSYNRGALVKTKFIFATPPLQNSVRHIKRPWVMPSSKNVTGIDFYTMSGRRVFHTDLTRSVDLNGIRPQVSAPGLYILNYTGTGNKLVNSEMRLFGR